MADSKISRFTKPLVFTIASLFLNLYRRVGAVVSKPTFEEVDVTGKIIVVTGATRGIGKALSKLLAKRGATIVLACRDVQAAEVVASKIRLKVPNSVLIVKHLNLASLRSIERFVEEMNQDFDHIDILVNNAGIMVEERRGWTTEDGLEINMGVNFIGTFHLTNLMLELLKASDNSRVVFVGSVGLVAQQLDFENPMKRHHSSAGQEVVVIPYSNSKYALALLSRKLAKQCEGSSVKSYYCCPGFVATDVFRNMGQFWARSKTLKKIGTLFIQTPTESAEHVLYCITGKASDTETGQMYRRAQDWNTKVYPDDLSPINAEKMPPINDELATKAWLMAESILKNTKRH